MLLTHIIFFIIFNATPANLGSFKNLLTKAQDKLRKPSKQWMYPNENALLYPGTNQTLRQINRDRWHHYYECLNQNFTQNPQALLGFEGHYIHLECPICVSPKEQMQSIIHWEWAPMYTALRIPIEPDEHTWFTKAILNMYNVKQSQSGQYRCRMGSTEAPPLFLTIVNATINTTEVHTKNAPTGPYTSPGQFIHAQVFLTMQWGAWSPCSRCGTIGRRYRLGYCVVKYQKTNKSTSFPSEITEKTLQILKLFPNNGIPCLSHILAKSLSELPVVKNRTSEIMTGFCKKRCLDQSVFEVRDARGNVIERANNSAGIYSMMQELPRAEPEVQRTLQYEHAGEIVVIVCPGNLNSETSVEWSIGAKKLIPRLINEESKGRIIISATDRIIIKQAKIGDSNIYSCSQNGKLTGTVRIIVEKHQQLGFNHHVLLFSTAVTLTTFLYVFTKAFFGRHHAIISK